MNRDAVSVSEQVTGSSKEEFKAFFMVGSLVAKASLQSTLDIADASSRFMAS